MSHDMKQPIRERNRSILPGQWQQRNWILHLHQFLFSLNLSIGSEDLVCCYWQGLEGRFYRIELLILEHWNDIQHGRPMPHPDFTSGYIAFWVPVVFLTVLLWALLQLTSRTRFTGEILRLVAGYVGLFLIPGLWALGSWPTFADWGWVWTRFDWWAPVEIAVAVFCTNRYVKGKWPASAMLGVALVVLHFAYWAYIPAVFPYSARSVPYLVGVCSSLVWGAYLQYFRQDNARVLADAM